MCVELSVIFHISQNYTQAYTPSPNLMSELILFHRKPQHNSEERSLCLTVIKRFSLKFIDLNFNERSFIFLNLVKNLLFFLLYKTIQMDPVFKVVSIFLLGCSTMHHWCLWSTALLSICKSSKIIVSRNRQIPCIPYIDLIRVCAIIKLIPEIGGKEYFYLFWIS